MFQTSKIAFETVAWRPLVWMAPVMKMAKELKEGAVRAGRRISLQELDEARQTVGMCSGLSRLELARTICEHWGWVTATGSHKVTACLNVLEDLERKGLLRLPGKQSMTRWSTDQARGAEATQRTNPGRSLAGKLSEVGSFGLEVVQGIARGVRQDWEQRWGYGPLLMESFVDPAKFSGACYRAAGWRELALTTGRGLARVGRVYQSTPKRIYVKALCPDFRERLCGSPLQGRMEP